ncbi:MAG: hypothetical protein JXQ97_00010 [Natronospirillum sp.]
MAYQEFSFNDGRIVLLFLPTARGQPKFNDPKRQTNNGAIRLCPDKRQTEEEESMVTQAFGWLPKFYYEHRADLLAFLNLYFNKVSGSRAYLRFRTTQTDELMFFMEIGFLMFSPSKWQLTATKTSMARKVKKSKGDRWKELSLGESDPSYNGYTLVLKNPNENLGKSSRYYSTNALRFIMHMALIGWPSGDVSHYRKKHRDPYSASLNSNNRAVD